MAVDGGDVEAEEVGCFGGGEEPGCRVSHVRRVIPDADGSCQGLVRTLCGRMLWTAGPHMGSVRVMTPDFMHSGAVRLRAAAAGIGMKQTEIAESLGVTPKTVGRWFRGEDVPTRERLLELEEALDLPSGDLCVLFGYLPEGTAEIVERDDLGRLLVRVSGSSNPGYLNEPLFDPDVLVAA